MPADAFEKTAMLSLAEVDTVQRHKCANASVFLGHLMNRDALNRANCFSACRRTC